MKKTVILFLLVLVLVSGCAHTPKNIRYFDSPDSLEMFVDEFEVEVETSFKNEHGQYVLVYEGDL